jgi:C4-dicarboxylate-binding protein DctP
MKHLQNTGAYFALLVFSISPQLAFATHPIVIRFSHVVAENTPKGLAALEFKRLVEKRTAGKVVVEVYPNSTLYKDKEELEALQLGAVQMLAPSLAKFRQLGLRDFELFDIPYIFPNKEVLHAVTQGVIGHSLLKQLSERGLLGLAFWDNGFKVMSSNTPLRIPKDLRYKRMRVQPSKALETQMEELGAIPVPLAFSDVYDALKSGLVDGTENPPSNLYSKNMHEVQRYVAVTNHGYLGYAVIVNKKFWDSLPSDLRTIVDSCMIEATKKNYQEAEKLNAAALNAVRAYPNTTVNDLTPAELELWRKALTPVTRRMEERIDRNLILNIKKMYALPQPSKETPQ